ncbi:MAG: hypothetical protein HC763_00890 [Hydrococcus sp. CRU_1_1]|nr:hypothetical protein [Hydrococcus sp. CRU_1_1]
MGGSLRNFQQFSFSPYWQFKASPWLPFVLNLVSTPVSREADVDPDRDAYINDNFFRHEIGHCERQWLEKLSCGCYG